MLSYWSDGIARSNLGSHSHSLWRLPRRTLWPLRSSRQYADAPSLKDHDEPNGTDPGPKSVVYVARDKQGISAQTPSHIRNVLTKQETLEHFLKTVGPPGKHGSTTSVTGTIYEFLCAQTLNKHFGFGLERVGGPGDSGVDLKGYWWIPSHSDPLPCIVQCKYGKSNPSAALRELEGTIVSQRNRRYPDQDIIGILCCTTAATKGITIALKQSSLPLIWMCIELPRSPKGADETLTNDSEGIVHQVLWNGIVAGLGAAALKVRAVYRSPGTHGHGKTSRQRELDDSLGVRIFYENQLLADANQSKVASETLVGKGNSA